MAREQITNDNILKRLVDKMHNQYKTLKSCFTDMNKSKSGFITKAEFQRSLIQWGFTANDEVTDHLYSWLDEDGDGKVSFDDLRHTAGKDIAPMEQLFFR